MTSQSVAFSRQKSGGATGGTTGATDVMDEADVEVGLPSNPSNGLTCSQKPSVVSKLLNGYRQRKSLEEDSTSNFLSSGNAGRFSRTDDEPDDDDAVCGQRKNTHSLSRPLEPSSCSRSKAQLLIDTSDAANPSAKDVDVDGESNNQHGQKADGKQVSFRR